MGGASEGSSIPSGIKEPMMLTVGLLLGNGRVKRTGVVTSWTVRKVAYNTANYAGPKLRSAK
jgi:hypothetical protein